MFWKGIIGRNYSDWFRYFEFIFEFFMSLVLIDEFWKTHPIIFQKIQFFWIWHRRKFIHFWSLGWASFPKNCLAHDQKFVIYFSFSKFSFLDKKIQFSKFLNQRFDKVSRIRSGSCLEHLLITYWKLQFSKK